MIPLRSRLWLLAVLASFLALSMGTSPRRCEPRFLAIDVFVDSKGVPLGAYQCELDAANSVIVGIEGGEHAAFAGPPHYDPAAMQQEHVIIAAYSLRGDLPIGRTRVARVHLMASVAVAPIVTLSLTTAADSQAQRIDAAASFAFTPASGDSK
ncbi:MAG: hypothetical protein JSR77_07595 [Planctomycetes bacterium]|nr:hypothetical protein [Planctomycetota bacterium]